ncbi:MAG: hypothetical protein JSW08_01055 [archaeon]|nr:MAG: hypothetical protein JSW08_01055 [archaeon]
MKVLYHGSPRKLVGNKLIPKKAKDMDKRRKHNLLKGIYASSFRYVAIAMAIISCSGVNASSLNPIKGKSIGVIYKGWPKNKYVYLHTLPKKTFKNIPKGTAQFVSFKPVKPIKTERIKISDYLHLVRKATKEEKKKWRQKYGKI